RSLIASLLPSFFPPAGNAASVHAVAPLVSRAAASAPFASRTCTTSTRACCAASINAVRPFLSFDSIGAPFASNACTACARPCVAASSSSLLRSAAHTAHGANSQTAAMHPALLIKLPTLVKQARCYQVRRFRAIFHFHDGVIAPLRHSIIAVVLAIGN